ncbi:MAG: beta-ketoacyl synthase N-terminal-like domain-containing protein [Limnobacter sp.]|uniref:beta-ketoacyl synthase N-terminal-like domain-containing protein n=1 Tax=Limnobacter sp. TaxID=2003368 RepID=UPI0022C5A4BA|nr:beta-ketoacyl synthase N-terminal-like domain-containing protein [Limnobacter sp.]MCZ8014424.1 beta-ketoacyl synthase N-terminal-like domain-containing protein [Limnobacter sp.]
MSMEKIAIIGMACVFPGARDLQSYWRNICDGKSAITEVPAQRWDMSHYDPQSRDVDKFYCKLGGFIDPDAEFDPLEFGIMPKTVESAEPDQLLALKIGQMALDDAGYLDKDFPREKTGVIVGKGNYVSAGVIRLEQHVRVVPQIVSTLKSLFPDLDTADIQKVKSALMAQLTSYGPDVASGLIPNFTASRLANRLDLHGPAYTVDAACASSLLAVEQACQLLSAKTADLMLVGGVHVSHDLTFWATFCQLGAMSRSGKSSPFSALADGILAGEGVGMVVLKRLDDALFDSDRIYAVIEGAGSASDGRVSSLVAPSSSGQLLAMERAWSTVGKHRSQIGLLEAHGTGTPAGDDVELDTVGRFFGEPQAGRRAVIGSVKSMIGHAMPASGMASLIKVALSVYHGVLPPTLNCDQPHPRLQRTAFKVLGKALPWNAPVTERLAGVNAFGFGGINAHLVLSGCAAGQDHEKSALLKPVLRLAASNPQALLEQLDLYEKTGRVGRLAGNCRLAVLDPDTKRLAVARKAIVAGKPWMGRQQVWFTPSGLLSAGGKVAFVFPGVDSQFNPRTEGFETFFDKPLPEYSVPQSTSDNLLPVVLGLLGFNRYLFDRLSELRVLPDSYAGHSIGEWSAMLTSGMMDQSVSDMTNASLKFDDFKFPDVRFLAASCSVQMLQQQFAGLERIELSHDNCPNQVIACGPQQQINTLAERLASLGVFHQVLPIVSGFHCSLFNGHLGWYKRFFDSVALRPTVDTVWSATTAQPFPAKESDKKALAIEHLVKPVRFRETILNMYESGVRVFVQVGYGSLPGFVSDTLGKLPHAALYSSHDSREGLLQLQHLCAALWVDGLDFSARLLPDCPVERPSNSAQNVRLQLGVPALGDVHVDLQARHLQSQSTDLDDPDLNDEVGQLIRTTLRDIQSSSREVVNLWKQARTAHVQQNPQGQPMHARAATAISSQTQPVTTSRLLDLNDTIPWVRDHELYPQKPDWPIVEDRHPVVPMTMEVLMVRDLVQEHLQRQGLGECVVAVTAIEAFNWLAVSKPVTVDMQINALSESCFSVEIKNYFRAVVEVAGGWTNPLEPLEPLQNSRDSQVDAKSLYRERWMFHGPAYQGVDCIQAVGDNGIDGVLKVPSGQGSLLDNMGQLAGYWVMELPENCLAMPIGVDRIEFHAADPEVGELLQAQVRIRTLTELECVSDHRLFNQQGHCVLSITGWKTRRYQMDKRLWENSRKLDTQACSVELPPNIALFEDRYDTAILRDYLSRRYLTALEQRVYQTIAPKRKRQWLAGRVAAKDAVFFLLKSNGVSSVFPQEMCVYNDDTGKPVLHPNVSTTVPVNLHISISHKDQYGVAIADTQPVGIDIERIDNFSESAINLAFSSQENSLVLRAGEDRTLGFLRAWVAKEAYGKYRGTGLGGHLLDYRIEARVDDYFCIGGIWVITHRLPQHVLGWTLPKGISPLNINASSK